ncbi:hypothetical protein D3H35_26955 [Cohnella faecalis]|uniref:Condensation domain-containing protein n=1 Tax=Cohnella faecalis TaxID=2315694 RepID=A0A398CDN5_9BACL|nr:condensation domain-containing protein [Cohnella faecalis]RIE00823.1 hypothetical protein D3H35_26955 [Cohnella faecalis]
MEPLRLQYKDFSEWQRNVFLNEQVAKQERFWLNRFSSEIPKLALPTDYPRPSYKSYEGDQVGFILDEKTTMSLKQLSLETETTLYMVLLSAFTILLSKISGQEDIVVGTPVAGRTHVDLANIMGIMINNICMRNLVDKDKIFMEFLKEIRQNTIEAYDNQTFPFEMLVEKLGVTAEPSRSVLFDAMFGLNSNLYSNSEHDTSNIEFIPSAVGNGTAKYNLNLQGNEAQNEIQLTMEYSIKLFKRETIIRLVEDYQKILLQIIGDRSIKIKDIGIGDPFKIPKRHSSMEMVDFYF